MNSHIRLCCTCLLVVFCDQSSQKKYEGIDATDKYVMHNKQHACCAIASCDQDAVHGEHPTLMVLIINIW